MTAAWELWVPGRPVPKARPRRGRGGRMFTPESTLDYERNIAVAAADANIPNMEGLPVELEIDLYADGVNIQCWALDTDGSGPLRGDVDNYIKSVMDGLQKDRYGMAALGPIPNDRMVVRVTADKGSYQ